MTSTTHNLHARAFRSGDGNFCRKRPKNRSDDGACRRDGQNHAPINVLTPKSCRRVSLIGKKTMGPTLTNRYGTCSTSGTVAPHDHPVLEGSDVKLVIV